MVYGLAANAALADEPSTLTSWVHVCLRFLKLRRLEGESSARFAAGRSSVLSGEVFQHLQHYGLSTRCWDHPSGAGFRVRNLV